MTDLIDERLLIAAPEAVAGKLLGILSAAGIEPENTVYSGEEALAACAQEGALVLSTYQLSDMTGAQLARDLGETADVLMIVPRDYSGETPDNAMTLINPISADALVQAVRTMFYARRRMAALRARSEKLARTLEERKAIDRAKGRLMDELHLTEAQAHHHIQKKSMDSGRRIVDVAREILEAETLEP